MTASFNQRHAVASSLIQRATERLALARPWHDLDGLVVKHKADSTVVTNWDSSLEAEIREELSSIFPEDSIEGEEAPPSVGSSDFTWYLDPIDGTENLGRGLPSFAISLGCYRGTEPISGVIAVPSLNLVLASTGDGVSLNGKPLKRPKKSSRRKVLGLNANPSRVAETIRLDELPADWEIRVHGSVAYDLFMLAIGRIDARVSVGMKAHDVAGGVALLSRLGDPVTDLAGRPWAPGCDSLLAARREEDHTRLSEIVRSSRP